ncbi:MAG TPA: hypothetical protein VGS14_10770 [Actinomycetes bacterium]|nr:hypothetical protein [Actinomycetes bacterium]
MAVDASRSAARPTSSTVRNISRCSATVASRPARRASFSRSMAMNAEHQPPLRPEAPKPATSRSTTASRSPGSARRR